jgi:hypothetical protein
MGQTIRARPMLLDSNIIIYAAQPQHEQLRAFVGANTPTLTDGSEL